MKKTINGIFNEGLDLFAVLLGGLVVFGTAWLILLLIGGLTK
jgi:hypothetical protein